MAGLSVYPLGNFACFCGLLIFSNTFKKKSRKYHQSVKQFGPRSGPTNVVTRVIILVWIAKYEFNQRVFLKVTSVLPKV